MPIARPIREIFYTPHFERAYRRLPLLIKQLAKERELIFRANALDRRLHTHKLKGRLSKFSSFSITQSYRIVFTFEKNDTVIFHDTGDHRVYR